MKVRDSEGPDQGHALEGAPVRTGCPWRSVRHLPSSHDALAFAVEEVTSDIVQVAVATRNSVLFLISAQAVRAMRLASAIAAGFAFLRL